MSSFLVVCNQYTVNRCRKPFKSPCLVGVNLLFGGTVGTECLEAASTSILPYKNAIHSARIVHEGTQQSQCDLEYEQCPSVSDLSCLSDFRPGYTLPPIV